MQTQLTGTDSCAEKSAGILDSADMERPADRDGEEAKDTRTMRQLGALEFMWSRDWKRYEELREAGR